MLPATLDGHDKRPTEPVSQRTAAWGDPAIALRCGVPVPARLRPTTQLITVNGVDWFGEQHAEGWTFTATGRRAYVEVVVPKDYAPEVNPLVDLAAALKGADPRTGRPY